MELGQLSDSRLGASPAAWLRLITRFLALGILVPGEKANINCNCVGEAKLALLLKVVKWQRLTKQIVLFLSKF